MAKTRLAQLIPSLPVGGAERMLLDLTTHLDPAKYDIMVVSLHALGSPMEREFAASGIEVVYLGKKLGFDARMFSRIAGALGRWKPDLVHTHRPVLQYAMPSLLGTLRNRVVHTVHNVAEHEIVGVSRKAAHWLAYRAGVATVAICRFVAESISRVYGVRPRALIPNGIPVSKFATPVVPRDRWRSLQGIPDGAVVFTCVARLSPQKNVSALLEAFAEVPGAEGDLLLVVGQGELQPRLEDEARARGIARRVRFLGARRDVADILAASDVFVLPSIYEGHPLSVMEAMAAGRPVIATSVGGVPEIVQQGATGLLVAPGDVGALAAAMLRLRSHAGDRDRMGRSGARVAAEAFDVSRMVAAYDRLYDEILSG